MAPGLGAVILAAGFSSRMGELKAALPLGTTTILAHCVELFHAQGIAEVVVVTGHQQQIVTSLATAAGARAVHNPDYAQGMYGSIRTGVGELQGRCQAFFLLPVDIPLVRRGTIGLVAQAYATTPARIVYPVFAGRRGHPPLLDAALMPQILAQPDVEGGLRTLLNREETTHPGAICEVAVADANIHFDMDTPQEYHQGLQRYACRGYPDREECAVLLDSLYPMPEKGRTHGQLVAQLAVCLCRALADKGYDSLNPELCWAGGWLHDVAKGHPRHEQTGGLWLDQLGFTAVAEIIAEHRDLNWQPGMAITEKELVFVADKLARGRRIVPIAERFGEKMTLYSDDPEAVAAIGRRREQALQVAATIEQLVGCSLLSLARQEEQRCAP